MFDSTIVPGEDPEYSHEIFVDSDEIKIEWTNFVEGDENRQKVNFVVLVEERKLVVKTNRKNFTY